MNCPPPRYWMCHIVIALAIAAVVAPFLGLNAGLASGVSFYAGREFTQWESGLPFDWKGIFAPFVACVTVLFIYYMVVYL